MCRALFDIFTLPVSSSTSYSSCLTRYRTSRRHPRHYRPHQHRSGRVLLAIVTAPVWALGRFGFGCLILAFGRVGFGCLISAFGRLAGRTAPCSGTPQSLERLPAGKRIGLCIGRFVGWEVRRLGWHLAPERLGNWKGCQRGQCIGLCVGRCGCMREVCMSMHVSCVSRRTSVYEEGFLLRIVFFFLSCNLLYPIQSMNLRAIFSVYSVSSVSSVSSVISCKW